MFRKKQDGKVVGTTLIEGLPRNQGDNIIVRLTTEKMLLIATSTKGNQEFEIDFSKLDSVEYKSETEMSNIVQQSAPGMIIGAAAFGIIGAMIGGRVKTKQITNTSHFLIINYTSGEQKQVVLQTNDGNSAKALCDYFRSLTPVSGKVSL